MDGHGSPQLENGRRWSGTKKSRARRVIAGVLRLLFSVWAVVVSSGHLALAQTPDSESLHLRFAWGGSVPKAWQGEIVVDGADLKSHRVLGLTADSPTTVMPREGKLIIGHQIPTLYGGVDFEIVPQESPVKVSIRLHDPKTDASFSRSWPIEELLAGGSEPIDRDESRLSVMRVPGDRLRVDFDRPHLIFEPGETFDFEVAPFLTELRSQQVRCQIRFRKNPNEVVETVDFTTDARGSAAPQQIQVPLPETEGVYELEFVAEPVAAKPAFAKPFSSRNSIRRRVQVVVVGEQQAVSDSQPWQTQQVFKVRQLLSGRTVTSSTRGIAKLPLGLTRQTTFRHGDVRVINGSAVELTSGSWIAVPVPRSPGPQQITIEYLPQPGTNFSVEFIDKNNQHGGGLNAGVFVPKSPGEAKRDASQWQRHQLHVWATEEDGWLLIANNDPTTSAVLSKVAIESGPDRLPEWVAGVAFNSSFSPRRQMAIFETPDFPSRFQAPRQWDSETGQWLDDWNTFLTGTDRLIQHLKANGFDGAFVTIATDGSSVFPAKNSGYGPRFDSGVFDSQGSDPIRKDVVELMMRMFDRAGLNLVPVINFNATLPELESQREPGQGVGFDLVDSLGNRSSITQRFLPPYNPLDRQLQQACNQAVSEISQRYRNHKSFGGMGVTCRPDCSTMLPGSRQAYDSVTINRFASAEGLDSVPGIRELEGDDMGPRWLQWRSEQMTRWYRELVAMVDSPLFLLPIDMYGNQELSSSLTPSLHQPVDFDGAMQSVGFDFMADGKRLTKQELAAENIFVASPLRVAPALSLARQRIDLNVSQTRQATQFFERTSTASVFTHRGRWDQIEFIDALPGLSGAPSQRYNVYAVDPSHRQRRFIRSLRQIDAGQMIHGSPTILPDMYRFNMLPAVPFETVEPVEGSPICVRQFSAGGLNWFYVLNDSPWPVEVSLKLGAKPGQGGILTASSARSPIAPQTLDGKEILIQSTTAGARMDFKLEPWSMRSGRSQSATSINPWHILSYEVELPDDAGAAVRKKLYQLQSKLARAKVGKPVEELKNGSFESLSDPLRSGWEFGASPQNSFDVSSDASDGKTGIQMKSSGHSVWIRSNPLASPKTGRLSVSVWLKVEDVGNQPPLRIAIEGKSDGLNFYRFGSVGSLSTGQKDQITNQWGRFAVHFDDLPVDLQNLRVGLDLMGVGKVLVDQVEIFDRWFDENDSVAMTQLLASAGSGLQSPASINNARNVLDSYWARFLEENIGAEQESGVSANSGDSEEAILPISGPVEPPRWSSGGEPLERKTRRNLIFGRKPRNR